MDTEKKELWDRLENEPERAYRAFESYLRLPSGERTILTAYRSQVGNPEASKPSDTWSRWSSQYAWRERAAAYDDHMTSKRLKAYERGVEDEAERQGVEAERVRHRMYELLTHSYVKSMEWFENVQASDLRTQDAIQIIKLHMEAAKTFRVTEVPRQEEGWTEEEDAELNRVVKEMEADRRDRQAKPDESDEVSENTEDEHD